MISLRSCAALAAMAAAALVAALPATAQQGTRISITTGGTGGVYYPLGGGMANILSKYIPGLQATAEVTGGSIDNLKLLGAGKTEVAFSMVDAAWEAAQGEDKFKSGKVNARTLIVLYPNRMHVVTVDGTGITKLADLKGKRVSTGSAGSGTEVMAWRVLEAVGIDPKKDIKVERLGVSESVNAIKDRKIDAFFWVGGLPTAAVTDLANTPGVKLKLIDHAELVPAMNKKHGELYVADVIPKDIYHGLDKDNRIASVNNLLVAHQNMDDKTAYAIVKAVFDHKDELVRTHKEAENIKLENQKKSASPVPWHPGAMKYFAEKGINLK